MKIQTVLGDIQPHELGKTCCHEHILWTVPAPYDQEDPDLGFDSIPAAVAEMRYLKSAGANALVEMTTTEIGRAALDYRQVSIASDIHIIAATGHHKQKFNQGKDGTISVDSIAAQILADLQEGMDGTSVKAGVIKAATSQNAATAFEARVIQAAGLAHQDSGAPVSTHTEGGSFALEQAQMLISAGVNPQKLLIGHLDRNLAMDIYRRLADMGVFLGFDQIGKQKYWSDRARIELVTTLIQEGYGDQILLSTDTARKSGWHTHNPQAHGPAFLFEVFLPQMIEAGIEEQQIEQMLVVNPARFLAF